MIFRCFQIKCYSILSILNHNSLTTRYSQFISISQYYEIIAIFNYCVFSLELYLAPSEIRDEGF